MYRSAWVTVTGKVFVDDEDVQALVECGEASILSDGDTKIENEEQAFEFLAQDALSQLFKTDHPMKYNEVIFDMSTFK